MGSGEFEANHTLWVGVFVMQWLFGIGWNTATAYGCQVNPPSKATVTCCVLTCWSNSLERTCFLTTPVPGALPWSLCQNHARLGFQPTWKKKVSGLNAFKQRLNNKIYLVSQSSCYLAKVKMTYSNQHVHVLFDQDGCSCALKHLARRNMVLGSSNSSEPSASHSQCKTINWHSNNSIHSPASWYARIAYGANSQNAAHRTQDEVDYSYSNVYLGCP